MDSSSADLSLGFIKKFDHFLPTVLHKRARLRYNISTQYDKLMTSP